MSENQGWIDIDTISGMEPLRQAVFSLGSNVGDRHWYLQAAVDALKATPGMQVTDVSSVYETKPVGPVGQFDFLNMVVLAESTLASMVMVERALAIEEALGRVRMVKQGPRTIDVDLIAVGRRQIHNETLTLPHPRAHDRAFVLVPWLEVDPAAELVGYGPVAALLSRVDTSGVQRTNLSIDL